MNARGTTGQTPLRYAAMFSPDPAIIQVLLSAGADPRVKADDGWTAFDAAGYNDSIRSSDAYRLLKPDGVAAQPSLLDLGAWRTADELRSLIEAGADVNEVGESGKTPLMLALSIGHKTDVIKALLDAGADVNVRDENGTTPLMSAVILQYGLDVIAALLEAGADANARTTEESWAAARARQR